MASERVFSCIGLVTNAIRNRLIADKASKLIYIHINQRVLNDNQTFRDWQEGEEEERVELENILIQMEEEEAPELAIDDEKDLEIDKDEEDEIDLTRDIEE